SSEGISDPRLAQVLADRAAEAVAYAQQLGVRFDPVEPGSEAPHLGWLAGHSYARAVHVGNAVGREMVRVLLREVKRAGIPIHSFTHATDLVVDDGVLRGVTAFHMPTGEYRMYDAPAVIVATG